MKLCPCCSNKRYLDCCGAYLVKKQLPETPEALMRSRYTAFVEDNIQYIKRTMRGPALADFNKDPFREKVQWLDLNVIQSYIEPDDPDVGYVEFKARYKFNKKIFCIHENSKFNKINNKWFYVSGELFTDPET
jgi:SEC-C motif-containing protein